MAVPTRTVNIPKPRRFKVVFVNRGGHWDFRFCGFGYFLDRFLCQKTSVFRFWCSLRFADFSFFCFWFSVFVENTSGFSVLLSNVLFGFSYFVLYGFPFLRFERQLISNRVFNLYLTTVQFISHIKTICTIKNLKPSVDKLCKLH